MKTLRSVTVLLLPTREKASPSSRSGQLGPLAPEAPGEGCPYKGRLPPPCLSGELAIVLASHTLLDCHGSEESHSQPTFVEDLVPEQPAGSHSAWQSGHP